MCDSCAVSYRVVSAEEARAAGGWRYSGEVEQARLELLAEGAPASRARREAPARAEDAERRRDGQVRPYSWLGGAGVVGEQAEVARAYRERREALAAVVQAGRWA